MSILLSVLGGFIYGYLTGTCLESFLHDNFMHSTWVHLYAFTRTKISHEDIHHNMTYRKNHVTQFRSAEEKIKVDSFLDSKHPELADWARSENYGLSLTTYSQILHTIPFLPMIVIPGFYIGFPFFCGSLLPILFTSMLARFIHPYFHCSFEEAMETASFLVRIILDTPIIREVWRMHYVHHKKKKFNFNLMPGGDWIRGVYVKPNEKEITEMEKLGLPMH